MSGEPVVVVVPDPSSAEPLGPSWEQVIPERLRQGDVVAFGGSAYIVVGCALNGQPLVEDPTGEVLRLTDLTITRYRTPAEPSP